jgi:hypothetical protein
LIETARALKSWSKPLFSNIRLQLHIVMEVILRLDIAQESRQLSDDEHTLKKRPQNESPWPSRCGKVSKTTSLQSKLAEGR